MVSFFAVLASVRPAPRRNNQETTTEAVMVDSEGERHLSTLLRASEHLWVGQPNDMALRVREEGARYLTIISDRRRSPTLRLLDSPRAASSAAYGKDWPVSYRFPTPGAAAGFNRIALALQPRSIEPIV